MTIRNLLTDSYYQQKKVLEKLLCHYVWLTKEELIISYEKEITWEQLAAIKMWYDSYTKDKRPLEYIVGSVEFFKRKFKVDERCLVPRPETEYMIQWVNEHISLQPKENANNTLIDVGTWCGVLWLSVLLENPLYFNLAILTEYFEDTFTLAKENYKHYAEQINCETHLVKCNLVEFLSWKHPDQEIAFDIAKDTNIILIANLPYIPDETFDTQAEDNVRKREPRPAFVGGKDGLDYYREMFKQLFDSGLTETTLFLEMMTWQVDILRQEFEDRMNFAEIKTFHFNIRIVKATIKK